MQKGSVTGYSYRYIKCASTNVRKIFHTRFNALTILKQIKAYLCFPKGLVHTTITFRAICITAHEKPKECRCSRPSNTTKSLQSALKMHPNKSTSDKEMTGNKKRNATKAQ